MSIESSSVVGRAAIDRDTSTVWSLSRSSASVPFVRQAENFGEAPPQNVLVPTASPSTCPEPPDEETSDDADYSLLQKSKKRRKTSAERSLALNERSFEVFAREKLADTTTEAKIAAAKKKFRESGLPLLRTALLLNTMNRIRGVALDIFKVRYPASISKTDLVNRLLTTILSSIPTLPDDIAQSIADVGIVQAPGPDLVEHEVVYLRKNAMTNNGEACVTACESLAGWVVREEAFVLIEVLRMREIGWGRLSERHREATITE
jgi:hypothetical protein